MKRVHRDEIDDLLERTYSADPEERAMAARALCPCHVKRNERRVWDRVIELARDPDATVRRHVFHLLGDGSPREREAEVVAVIESMMDDPDLKLRRRARKLMASYRRGSTINLL